VKKKTARRSGTEALNNLDSLRMRIDTAATAERAFIRYGAITVTVLVLTAVAKSSGANAVSVSILGGFEVPTTLIAKQVWIIRIFCTCLLAYAFAEWALAIIDVNRHPLSSLYGDQKSLVVEIANWWDRHVKAAWLQMMVLLDILQKLSFVAMVVLIVVSLWTL